jgi:predicted RNA-binding protein with PUA-like domain
MRSANWVNGHALSPFASLGMTKIKNYWLMKSEPDVYSWDDLVAEGEGTWDGVRNYTARLNLRAMAPGDQVFFYHSNIGVEIVGIAEITASNIPDPTDGTGRWSAVKLKPVRKLNRAVTLKEIKADAALADMDLLTKFRLSVSAVKPAEWGHILDLSEN